MLMYFRTLLVLIQHLGRWLTYVAYTDDTVTVDTSWWRWGTEPLMPKTQENSLLHHHILIF